jgi:Mitochondrial carrier protein
VKTAVQGRPLDGQHRVATTDAALDILRRRGGLLGLYRGALPSVLRAFIVSGSRFTTYEAVAAWWRNSSPSV